MKTVQWFLKVFFFLVFFASCSTDDSNPNEYIPQGDFDSGVLVLNEGNFLVQDNASVSYISFDLTRSQVNIFGGVNPNAVLGNTAQSIGFNGNLAYIVLNGSAKIQIVNRYTMVKVGEISSGLVSPRYIAFANGKGYVSDWGTGVGAGTVKIVDLGSNTISSSIPVADYPNRVIEAAGKLYVAHNDRGTSGNSISIIDSASNTVSDSIVTGALPDVMVIVGNNLWVSCNGVGSWPNPANESAGIIQKIDLTTNSAVFSLAQSSNNLHVTYMDVFGNDLYYVVNNDIFKMPLSATTLPSEPAFTSNAMSIYGFAVKNNRIYIADAKTFDVNGDVIIYTSGAIGDPNPVGTRIATIGIGGVGPNGFYFNQ